MQDETMIHIPTREIQHRCINQGEYPRQRFRKTGRTKFRKKILIPWFPVSQRSINFAAARAVIVLEVQIVNVGGMLCSTLVGSEEWG
jgi:hypothetical protein